MAARIDGRLGVSHRASRQPLDPLALVLGDLLRRFLRLLPIRLGYLVAGTSSGDSIGGVGDPVWIGAMGDGSTGPASKYFCQPAIRTDTLVRTR